MKNDYCKQNHCGHYVDRPKDKCWCTMNREFYKKLRSGEYKGRSEPTNHGVTDSSVCGDYGTRKYTDWL